MAEVPEEVLPEEWLTAPRGLNQLVPKRAVEQQHGHARREHRQRQEQEDRRDERSQTTSGMRKSRMPAPAC